MTRGLRYSVVAASLLVAAARAQTIDQSCFTADKLDGTQIGGVIQDITLEECVVECRETENCVGWSYFDNTNGETKCHLYSHVSNSQSMPRFWTSGPPYCSDAPTLSPTSSSSDAPTDSPAVIEAVTPAPIPSLAPTDAAQAIDESCFTADKLDGTQIGGVIQDITLEECVVECRETENCVGWSHFDNTNGETKCHLYSHVSNSQSMPRFWTSGPPYCSDAPTLSPTSSSSDAPTDSPAVIEAVTPAPIPSLAPTDAPTDAPTPEPTNEPTEFPSDAPTPQPSFAPVVQHPGCILENTRYRTTSGGIAGYWANENAVAQGILSAENCHAKCEEVEACNYWTYFDAANKNCKLFKYITTTSSAGSAYTSGPKFCTAAPTGHPTDVPTQFPTNFPTLEPTDAPTEEEGTVSAGSTGCSTTGVKYVRGNTIKRFPSVASPEDCNDICRDYPDCAGWSWKEADGRCWLMKNAYQERALEGYVSGPRECPPDPACEVQFYDYVGGEDVERIENVDSAGDCAIECSNNAACETWTWLSHRLKCFLRKDTRPEPVARNAYYFTGTKEDCEDYVSAAGATPAPTLTPLDDGAQCSEPRNDVIFIMDGSGSTDSKEWKDMKQFVRQLASGFSVSPTNTLLAVVRYSTYVYTEWTFDEPEAMDLALFQESIDDLEAESTGSATGGGLIRAKEILESTELREGTSNRVAILVTSGRPNKVTDCKAAGYPGKPFVCPRQVGEDLRAGPDGIHGTEDDVYLVYVRIGDTTPLNLFRGEEDLFVQLNQDNVVESADIIINDLCVTEPLIDNNNDSR